MNIVFVILHYLTDDLTVKCVDYIKKNCDTESFHIVIVDNASPNDSYSVLKKTYDGDTRITLIHNEENLGFARGNNVGFRYAVKLEARYIVLLNNDAFLTEKNLYEKLESEYLKSGFALAGPRITDTSGEGNGNPFDTRIVTIPFCRFMIRRKKFDLAFTKINAYGFLQIMRRVLNKVGLYRFPDLPSLPDLPSDDLISEKKLYRCVLHGCCMIFSPSYTAKYDGLDERTYMFCEENILQLQLLRDRKLSVYMPEINVMHVGQGATNKMLKKDRARKIFAFKHAITGWGVCLDILQKYRETCGHELYEDILNSPGGPLEQI